MVVISHAEYRVISVLLCTVLFVLFFAVKKLQFPYVVPNHYIIRYKYIIWSFLKFLGVLFLVILPLDIKLLSSPHTVTIILDNSLSMRSEDQAPTRLGWAEHIIKELDAIANINNCITLQSQKIDGCNNISVLPSSWSTISDALLLAMEQNKWSNSQSILLVLTDWGMNEGITLDQFINSWNQSSIIWVDILPHTWNIIIYWSVVGQNSFIPVQGYFHNYITTSPNDSPESLTQAIKNAVLIQQSYISLNGFFIIFIIWIGVFFVWSHLSTMIGSWTKYSGY